MNTLQKIVLMIALVTLISSCQTNKDPKQLLSDKETRKGIMDTIVNNTEMMKEMTDVMMNNKNGKMMMQGNEKMNMMMMENRGMMMKVMKDNPGMMQSLMTDMLESCNNDTNMMSGFYETMIGNRQMMDMWQKRKGEIKDMLNMGGKMEMDGRKKMDRMDNMNGMDNNKK